MSKAGQYQMWGGGGKRQCNFNFCDELVTVIFT
jgi:hypothetical protein